MAITADYHLHSAFSGDGTVPMEIMIRQAVKLGLTHLCFTEHMDIEYPMGEENAAGFEVNTDSYLYDLITYKEKYADRIKILFGIELGLQPHLKRELALYTKSYDFDFIIGSSHIVNKKDPYYPSFYEGRREEDCYREYFASIIENIHKISNFDVYGHLDYIVRYGPSMDKDYSYEKYKDIFDEMLTLLIGKDKGIEINTGGLRKGLRETNPCLAVIRRYRELGGEIITVGSDAHTDKDIAADFHRAAEILTACGFKYYTIFEKRLPEFKRI